MFDRKDYNLRVQLKPYLYTWRAGSTLRIGNMPPNGVEVEDAPGELDDLIRMLSRPGTIAEVADRLAGRAGIDETGWTQTIQQLIDAGVVGPHIPQTSRYARHFLYFDLLGLDPETAQRQISTSRVAVVGCGGIGSSVATLLTGAGVGRGS